jgi:hypothetical protein
MNSNCFVHMRIQLQNINKLPIQIYKKTRKLVIIPFFSIWGSPASASIDAYSMFITLFNSTSKVSSLVTTHGSYKVSTLINHLNRNNNMKCLCINMSTVDEHANRTGCRNLMLLLLFGCTRYLYNLLYPISIAWCSSAGLR